MLYILASPQAMSDKTGVSWNKRFKKQFGPINKVSGRTVVQIHAYMLSGRHAMRILCANMRMCRRIPTCMCS